MLYKKSACESAIHHWDSVSLQDNLGVSWSHLPFSGCSLVVLTFSGFFFTLVTLITLLTRGRDVRRSKNRSAPICSGSAARGFWQFHMISHVKKLSDALCLSDVSARPDQHRPSRSIWNPEGAQLHLWKPETRRMSLIMSWMSLNSWRRSRRKYVSEWQRRRLGKYQVTNPCGGPVFFYSPLFLKKNNRPNLSFATRLAQTICNHFFEAKACRRDVIKKEIASDCARSIGKQKWKCCGDWSIDISPVHSNCRWSSSTLANCQQLGRGRVTSRATSNHRPRLPLRPLCAGGTPLRARTVAPPRHVWRLKKFEESPKCLKTASKCINCNAVTASNIKPIQATEPPSAQLCDARLFLQSSWNKLICQVLLQWRHWWDKYLPQDLQFIPDVFDGCILLHFCSLVSVMSGLTCSQILHLVCPPPHSF